MNCLLLFNVIVMSFLYLPKAVLNCLVVTPSGTIEGVKEFYNGIAVRAFLGIPYVKPPIGNLRFKKPLPIEPWNTNLNATMLPPGCVQYSPNPFPWVDYPPGLSINCLYLNIWTPMTSNSLTKKTVMFWIHGGGWGITSNRLDFLNGKALAVEGDVIVVTINYRLGVEGFLYSGTEDAPGNMGMWDMVEALKWVRKYIKYFGGDENSITLFGQSCGGISIGMLCVSPVTRGLFKRVIMQSGSPTNLDGEDVGRSFRTSQELAVVVGCAKEKQSLNQNPKAVIECLRGKNPFELAVTLKNITQNFPRSSYPRFGDDFLPVNPRLAIIEGNFSPVDVLIGTNNGDGATLITKTMKDVFGFFGEKNPVINYTFGSSIIKKKFKNYPYPDAVVTQYLGRVQKDNYDKIRFEVFTASGDFSRICPSNYFAESFAKRNPSVYYYFFTHRPSFTPWAPWMLAVHHDETPFVFGYPLRYPEVFTLEEQMLSKRMIHAWSTFAKTGIPEYGQWPLYSKENPIYQVIDVSNSPENGVGPHKENCDFFRSFFGF